ncbi:hypothetical protein VTP01DRAFT_1121 [Rhizomucor pusillus]|uniref:uncharacterized protein n=1 Tax=Rhizomucor pusillus TaxID=4840 RepID=UPI00374281BD
MSSIFTNLRKSFEKRNSVSSESSDSCSSQGTVDYKFTRSKSTASAQPPTSQAIPIRPRANSTLFGISQHSADDYVQKDLISSSWS